MIVSPSLQEVVVAIAAVLAAIIAVFFLALFVYFYKRLHLSLESLCSISLALWSRSTEKKKGSTFLSIEYFITPLGKSRKRFLSAKSKVRSSKKKLAHPHAIRLTRQKKDAAQLNLMFYLRSSPFKLDRPLFGIGSRPDKFFFLATLRRTDYMISLVCSFL